MITKTKRRPVVLYQPRDEGSFMPLGLLALASRLAAEHVVLVDGRFELAPEARLVELTRDARCLGVTVRTGRPLLDALRVTAAVRTSNPKLTVVWGGAHASAAPRSCLASGLVHGCVRGAGEEAFSAVVAAMRGQGARLPEVRGLLREGAAVAEPSPVPDADATQPPPYSLLDLERYFETRGVRRLDYAGSRGMREDGFRGLPADRVIAEIGELTERYRLAEVVFRDADFFAEGARAEAVVTGLAEGTPRVGWLVAARPEDLNAERLRLLAAGRCRRVLVRVPPDVSGRSSEREAVLAAAAGLKRAGLAACFELWISSPGPKGERLTASVSLARSLSAMHPHFETPIRQLPPAVGDDEGISLEAWVERVEERWADRESEKRLANAVFFLSEAQRPPRRRPGQHLLRLSALVRVRLGTFGLALERAVVEAAALVRTGRPRNVPPCE